MCAFTLNALNQKCLDSHKKKNYKMVKINTEIVQNKLPMMKY